MKKKLTNLSVWMEVKLVLAPSDYRQLKNQARQQSRNVAEFVNQLIDRHLKSEASQS